MHTDLLSIITCNKSRTRVPCYKHGLSIRFKSYFKQVISRKFENLKINKNNSETKEWVKFLLINFFKNNLVLRILKAANKKFLRIFFPKRRVKMFITQVISHYIVIRFELVCGFTCLRLFAICHCFQFYFLGIKN